MMYCSNCGATLDEGIVFCPSCGTKIEIVKQKIPSAQVYREEFVSPSVQKAERSFSPNNVQVRPNKSVKVRSLKGMSVLIVLLMVGAGISMITLSQKYDIQEERNYNYTSPNEITKLDFILDVASGSVSYFYNTTPTENIVQIDAKFDFTIRAREERSLDTIYDIIWDANDEEVFFEIRQIEWFHWALWDQTQFIITLRTDIDYGLDIDTNSGLIALNIPQNTNFEYLNLRTGSGSIYSNFAGNSSIYNEFYLYTGSGGIELSGDKLFVQNDIIMNTGSGGVTVSLNNSRINGLFDVDTGSGGVDLFIQNSQLYEGIKSNTGSGSVTYSIINSTLGGSLLVDIGSGGFTLFSEENKLMNDTLWDIDSGSGGVSLNIVQHTALGGLIDAVIETGSGSMTINLDVNSTLVPSSWNCDTGSGDVNFISFSNTEYSIGDDLLQTVNYTGLEGFKMELETGSGGITIYS